MNPQNLNVEELKIPIPPLLALVDSNMEIHVLL
jgi:hypothetical protein